MRGADGRGITFTKEGRAHDSNKVRGVARGGGVGAPLELGRSVNSVCIWISEKGFHFGNARI